MNGLDIFMGTPKTDCEKYGYPTCMAFAMRLFNENLAELDENQSELNESISNLIAFG
jgi:ArsR family metal-binding transcriptional regulator